jgi:hypothetical protein
MFLRSAFVATSLFILVASGVNALAAQYGTAEEAKAMLEKAVTAVKANKTNALEMFHKGEGGFKDRDLYVFCADASTGIVTAHPTARVSS